jgi:hypothetical protein
MIKERLLERGAFFVGIVAGKTARVIRPGKILVQSERCLKLSKPYLISGKWK